tara:strand:- start:259 stop:546 length:288 start_codon:yes stop_codon:yes gene_type:complete
MDGVFERGGDLLRVDVWGLRLVVVDVVMLLCRSCLVPVDVCGRGSVVDLGGDLLRVDVDVNVDDVNVPVNVVDVWGRCLMVPVPVALWDCVEGFR